MDKRGNEHFIYIENWNDVCRLCLRNDQPMQNLFVEQHFLENIQEITNLAVSKQYFSVYELVGLKMFLDCSLVWTIRYLILYVNCVSIKSLRLTNSDCGASPQMNGYEMRRQWL